MGYSTLVMHISFDILVFVILIILFIYNNDLVNKTYILLSQLYYFRLNWEGNFSYFDVITYSEYK